MAEGKKVHLWRGLHSKQLHELLKKTWAEQELLILVPLYMKDLSFMSLWEPSRLVFHGDWPEELRSTASTVPPALTYDRAAFDRAVLGVFTSGTSLGTSRLVFYARENVLASLDGIRSLYETSRIQHIFCYPQPTHTFGLVLGYLHSVVHDLPITFCEGPYSRKAHELWLKEVTPQTLTLGTPTHFIDLLSVVRETNAKPKASYSAILGGARVTRDLWSRLREELLIEAPSVGYGATEASPGVTHLPPGVVPREDGDIGYVLPNVKLEAMDEQGIVFSGPNLCLAIYEQNHLKFYDRLRLRDHLVMDRDEHGPRYSFLGRVDLIINRGGAKFSLESIEGHVSAEFGVRAVAVSVYDPRLGEDLGLVVDLRRAEITKEKIQHFLSAEYALKIPAMNILFGDIPLNPNGKFDRKEALRFLLKTHKWNYPVAIDYVKPFLPHRGSAIWVDEIISSAKNTGRVRVKLNKQSMYAAKLIEWRESSFIEWMAQSYGYIVALNDLMGVQSAEQARKTFIVEVKSADFPKPEEIQLLKHGDEIEVEVTCTHDFHPLKLVEGQVFWKEKLLARSNLKLYSGS